MWCSVGQSCWNSFLQRRILPNSAASTKINTRSIFFTGWNTHTFKPFCSLKATLFHKSLKRIVSPWVQMFVYEITSSFFRVIWCKRLQCAQHRRAGSAHKELCWSQRSSRPAKSWFNKIWKLKIMIGLSEKGNKHSQLDYRSLPIVGLGNAFSVFLLVKRRWAGRLHKLS